LSLTRVSECVQSCPWVGLTHGLGWVKLDPWTTLSERCIRDCTDRDAVWRQTHASDYASLKAYCHHLIESIRFPFNFNRTYASISYRFQNTASCLLSEVANFNLSRLHLAPTLGVTPVEFRGCLWHLKKVLRASV